MIGTHGKLKSWMSKKFLELAALKILVLDEADEMLKVGNNYFDIFCPKCSLSAACRMLALSSTFVPKSVSLRNLHVNSMGVDSRPHSIQFSFFYDALSAS